MDLPSIADGFIDIPDPLHKELTVSMPFVAIRLQHFKLLVRGILGVDLLSPQDSVPLCIIVDEMIPGVRQVTVYNIMFMTFRTSSSVLMASSLAALTPSNST
jgi:hypothetical protein